MKKLLTAIVLTFTLTTAQSATMPNFKNPNAYQQGYKYGYARGEHHAKQEMQERIYKTATVAGVAVIASVIIYQWGKNSNWTVSQNGVGYRF